MSAATVIQRFREDVVASLRRQSSDGAANLVWERAALLEPHDRSFRTKHEAQRLVLLGDRAVRQWVPKTVRTLGEPGLDELAEPVQPVRSATDAAIAAARIGAIRQVLRSAPDSPRAATPAGVATALSEVQALLRQLGGLPESFDAVRASAVGHAAQALIACFDLGAHFEGGIPGETAATVVVLDALDDEARIPVSSTPNRHLAHESDLHRTLVSALVSQLAWHATVTHATGVGNLPGPPKIGRHSPDVLARTAAGTWLIGEAKLGDELFDAHSQEQLADFLAPAPDGPRAILHLMVPKGRRAEAERAAIQAAGSAEHLHIWELGTPA